MNRGWNALVDHLPELANPRGLLRAALMVLVPLGVTLAVLWFVRPLSAMLAVAVQIAVLGLAHYMLADFFQPGRRAYADAFYNRLLPVMGLHAATLMFILTSSATDVTYERVIPPLPVGILLSLYLTVTGIALLWRAASEAGIATLCGVFVYFPEGARPISGSLYSEIRHPVYAGLARLALAFAALSGTAFALMLALIFVFVYQPRWIDLEESELSQRFGEDYTSFAAGRPAMFPSSVAGEIDLVRRAFVGAPASADTASA